MKVGKRLAHVITQEQDDHEGATDPYHASNGISIPCLCVITSHTLHFLSLLTYADPIFKVRARTKQRNGFFFFRVSPCMQCKRASVYFHLLNLPKIAVNIRPRIPTQREEKGKGGKKDESIKINSVLPHSFSDKQQLHRIGNKYYLCDKKNNTARFSRVVHKA